MKTFGDSVNVAARMAGLALSGQALTTVDTVAALSAHLREAMRRLDALPVKGKTDQSSNGTFVTIGGGGEIRLRREEMILHSSGVIPFGHSAKEPGGKLVEFGCAWG